jgi:hypothetical protein
MNKVFAALTAGIVALSAPSLALAQATDPAAVAQATTQQVCGEAAVIRAIFLDDGRLQVTCPRGSVPGNPSALGGTGLTPGLIAAGAGVVLIVAVIAGDDDSSGTTTTTTGTN